MKNQLLFLGTKMQTADLLPEMTEAGSGYLHTGKRSQGGSIPGMLRWLAVLMLLVSFSLGVNAQKIEEYHSLLSKMKSSGDPAMVAEGNHLQSLVTDLHPIAYLNWGQQKKYGEGAPVVVSFDASSVNMLYGNNPAFSMVELMKINIGKPQELKQAIDLDRLGKFESLKYLLIVFEYDVCGGNSTACLPSLVRDAARGEESPVTVLYMLSIPE